MRIFSTLCCFALIISFGLIQAQVPGYVPKDGLIGWWPFNGNANDESGNGNHGILKNDVSFSKDRFSNLSNAITLLGDSSYIVTSLDTIRSNAYTISCWFKTSEIMANEIGLVVSRRAPSQSDGLYLVNTNQYIQCVTGCDQGFHYNGKTEKYNDDKWHHFVSLFDGKKMFGYVDGKLFSIQNLEVAICIVSPFEFGRDNPYGRYFKGEMDDIGIWERALSEQEVKDLYDSKQNVSVIPDYVPSNGLIGWWPFNGNANDESGNGNHGIVHGAVLTGDRYGNYGKAFSYDGQNDYIEVNNDTTLCPTHYTISAWVYPTGFYLNSQDDANYIIGKGNDFNNGHYSLHYNSISKKARASIGIGSSGVFVNSESDMSLNNWYHLISTWDGKYLRIYINGILENTMSYPSNIQGVNNENLFFGTMATNSTWPYWLNGKIDDIGIWNRALDSNDILKLYQGTSSNCSYSIKESDTTVCPGNSVELNAVQTSSIKSEIPKNGLVGYWPFNGNANDESGNGNNGTVNGAILTTDRCDSQNQAFSFKGKSWIEVPNANYIDSNNIGSISFWVKSNSLDQLAGVCKSTSSDSIDFRIFGDANDISFIVNGKDFHFLNSSGNLDKSKWNNLIVTFNDNDISLYINGKQQAKPTLKTTWPITKSTTMKFGFDNHAMPEYLDGSLDEIAIWKRVLTNEEVQQVYYSSPCGCTDTLSNDKFVWSDGQKGRKITVKPDTTTTYVLSVADGATLHRDSIKVTVGGDSCITCIYGIKQNDTTICQGTVLELNAELTSNTHAIPKEGLIGWWPFNGNANDESGNGNHGTLFNTNLVKDRNNRNNSAYSLNGNDAYISIGNFISPPLADSTISITGWIKTDYENPDMMTVVGARGNGPTCFAINPNNLITCTFANAGGGFHNFYSDDFVISDGKWHFFAMIYDGKTQRTYLDSTLIWKSDFQFDLLVNGLLEFGRDNPYGRYFNGILDDIAIWNRAISHSEVKTMYELNRPKPAPSIPSDGLVGYWPFDGNAKDMSGNGLHGVVNGPLLVEDRFGNPESAYSFSGLNDNIVIDTAFFDNGWDSFTFTCWVYLNEANNPKNINSNHVFLNTIPHNGLGIGYNWGDSQRYDFSVGNGKPATQWNTNLFVARGITKFEKQQWKMVALVKSQKTYSMYVDGIKENTYECDQEILSHFYKVALGSSDLGVCNEVLDGILDDVCIWNRALNVDEISDVYHMQNSYCTDTLPEDKFIWSTGEKGRKITVAPNASTMYTLEVDRGKIIDRDTIHVTVLESPTPDIFGHVKVYERQINYSYYTPFNDSSTYEWSITGNGKLSSTNGGSSILVDFKEPGYAYLTVTETNKYGCKKDTTITIRVYRMTDIADSEIDSEELNIYPNPMNEFGSVMVKAFIPPSSYASISIVDMLGKNLVTSELDGQNAYREIHVPISTESLVNGIYMIQVRMDGTVISKKLIINR